MRRSVHSFQRRPPGAARISARAAAAWARALAPPLARISGQARAASVLMLVAVISTMAVPLGELARISVVDISAMAAAASARISAAAAVLVSAAWSRRA